MREAVFIVVRLDCKCFKTYITSTFNIKYPTMENKRTIRKYGRCQGVQLKLQLLNQEAPRDLAASDK